MPPKRVAKSAGGGAMACCAGKPAASTRRPIPARPPEPEPEPEPHHEPEPEPEQEPEPEPKQELKQGSEQQPKVVQPLPMEPVEPVSQEAIMHELIFRAASLRAEGRWAKAIDLYRDAIDQGRKIGTEGRVLADLYTGKGECHEALGNWQELEFDLCAALRLGGGNGFQQRWRHSAVLSKLERYTEAKEELEAAIAVCPHTFTERAELERDLADVLVSVSKMPAVLWSAGPALRVVDYESRVDILAKPYLVYLIEVQYLSDDEPVKIYKRFSDVERLHLQLAPGPDDKGVELPPLPEKTWSITSLFGTDDEVGQVRVKEFHSYFRALGDLIRTPSGSAAWQQRVRPLVEEFITAPEVAARAQLAAQVGAAVMVQAWARGRAQRKSNAISMAAATRVQSFVRGRSSRAATAVTVAAILEEQRLTDAAEVAERARLRYVFATTTDKCTLNCLLYEGSYAVILSRGLFGCNRHEHELDNNELDEHRLQSAMSFATSDVSFHDDNQTVLRPPVSRSEATEAENDAVDEVELARRARVKALHQEKLDNEAERLKHQEQMREKLAAERRAKLEAEERKKRIKVAELLQFSSTADGDPEYRTNLLEYVSRMPEEQSQIFYVCGTSREELEHLPVVRHIVAEGSEVLYMLDPIDEYTTATQLNNMYAGKTFADCRALEFDEPLRDAHLMSSSDEEIHDHEDNHAADEENRERDVVSVPDSNT